MHPGRPTLVATTTVVLFTDSRVDLAAPVGQLAEPRRPSDFRTIASVGAGPGSGSAPIAAAGPTRAGPVREVPCLRLGASLVQDRLQSRECARVLKGLADADRLKIVQCLVEGPRNVTELAAILGKELAAVSHHLGVLRNTGLVLEEKRGRFMYYALHPDVFRHDATGVQPDRLDLGCCKIELTGDPS